MDPHVISNELRTSNQNTPSDNVGQPNKTHMSSNAQKPIYLSVRPTIMGIIICIVFTSIAMIVGVLTVYFTTPKLSTTCQMTFRRMMKSSVVYSSEPRAIAVADLNNDQQMDMVVVNSGTNTISIFLSNVNGTFTIQQTYSTGSKSRPRSVVIGDFNNDNYLDIAVANYGTNNIGIFFASNHGKYHNQSIVSTASFRPWFITTADFNKDNHADIAVVFYGTDNIGILLNDGDGTFQQQLIYSTGYDSLPYSLAVADFNNDQHLDIVVTNYGTSNIGMFFGQGNGMFTNQKIYSTTRHSQPSSIAVGDLNNDKQPDLIVANYGTSNVDIFLSQGDGSFAPSTSYDIGSKSHPQFLVVGYIDADNSLDVVVVDSDNDRIHFLLGYGNGSFATLNTYDSLTGSNPVMIGIADFNNDNRSDIAVVDYGTSDVLVLSGYSIQPSARQTNYFIGRDSRPTSVVVYDFNNDSHLDIAVNNFNDNYIVIFSGTENGSFVRENSYSTGDKSGPQYICIGDLNHDDRMDIVVANLGSDSIGVLLGQNNGTFGDVTIYLTGVGSTPWFAALGDFNNDTHLDIVSVNTGSGSISIFQGYGDGCFIKIQTYSTGTGSQPWSAAIGDINSDEYLDIIVANAFPGSLHVFMGYGNGSFGNITAFSNLPSENIFMIVLADINRDGYLDIIVSYLDTGKIGVLIGNGDGTYQKVTIYSIGSAAVPYYITVADLNSDGFYDIASTDVHASAVVIFYNDKNGSFELARTYFTGTGSTPYGITTADLSNDKHLEIIVTHWGTGDVGVLTEYYAAEFVTKTTYPTGSAPHPYSLAVGDFNADNRSDVVIANSDADNLGILVGLNNGTFASQMIYSLATNSYPQYVITGDVNKDNYLDIVVVSSKSSTMSVIMGYGNGTFANQVIYSTGVGSQPYAVIMSDVNNDHRYDFVVANKGTDSIGIFFGYDYTTFQRPRTYVVENSSAPISVVVSDFNNDKYLDTAVVFQTSTTLVILLGQSDGTFVVSSIYSTGVNSSSTMVAVHDFNNDKQMDIVVANSGTDNIAIFLGYGNGSFGMMMAYSTGEHSKPSAVAIGDFNNDGIVDIVSANSGTNTIGILLGFGNESFLLLGSYSTGDFSNPSAVAVDDFNNDKILDVAVTNYGTNVVGIFLGYGNGSFQTQVIYSTGYHSSPLWITINDFNGDNQSDIAVTNYDINYISIFLGHGNGTFTNVTLYSCGDGVGPASHSVGDFNNDNILDIVVANNIISSIIVLFGIGDGSFLSGINYPTDIGFAPQSIAVGDFNNDSQLDIVVTDYSSNRIGVFLGLGRELFASATEYATGDGSQPHSVAVADFNNDGFPDIAVANYGTDNVGILLGHGGIVFDTMITYSTGTGSAPYSLAIADFNDDNHSDIVVSNSETNNIVIFVGYGNGTFWIIGKYSTGDRSRPYQVAIGDLNNDNQLDIVVANSGTSNIFFLYGYGNGSFSSETSYSLGFEYFPYSVAVTDLNNDKWMDMVIACYGTDNIETLVKMC